MSDPLRVLFVCTANISRSPFMELTARSLAGEGADVVFATGYRVPSTLTYREPVSCATTSRLWSHPAGSPGRSSPSGLGSCIRTRRVRLAALASGSRS